MKIAILGDLHYGCRNDQLAFLDYQKRFFDDIFFPTMEKEKITTIIQLGDLVDRRKYINYNTLKRMKTDFLDRLDRFNVFILAGNHDIYFRNTSMLNALDELLKPYPKIMTFTEATESGEYLFVPWITPENRERTEETIRTSNAKLCFGHLELSGFTMNPGTVADHGDDPSLYSKFEQVFSGHYHSKSTIGNINYLGAPFGFTWGDFGDVRGFHLFDLQTRFLEFVENPHSLFRRFTYNDRNGSDDYSNVVVENCYVKVVVDHKASPSDFEKYVRGLEAKKPLDLKIVETKQLVVDNDTFDGTESTPDIIRKYISEIQVDVNKKNLEKVMLKLYDEALQLER